MAVGELADGVEVLPHRLQLLERKTPQQLAALLHQRAAALRDARTPAEAFASFESARRSRVERIVAAGARSTSAKVPGRVGRLAQEAVLRLVFRYAVTDRSQAWITGHRVHLGAQTGRR